ncbi:MAG: hypothetical protein IKG93_06125 [Clostridiales bacterium]|nr:hypothetical protein [Clostridiales bacterium]
MKKVLSTVLAAVFVLSLTGCSGGGKFKTISSAIEKAMKNDADAEEVNKKQKKAMCSDDFDPSDSVFESGCYYTLTSDEAKDSTFGFDGVEEGDLKNAFLACKSESDSAMMFIVMEATDKDIAQDIYDGMLDGFDISEKNLKAAAKKSDLEYGIDDEKDNQLVVLAISPSDQNMATGLYLKVDSKVITAAVYRGEYDTDLYEEFCDVMFDGKLYDMESLLE